MIFKSICGICREIPQATKKSYHNLIKRNGTKEAIENNILGRNNELNTGISQHMTKNNTTDLADPTDATPLDVNHFNDTPKYYINMAAVDIITVNIYIVQVDVTVKKCRLEVAEEEVEQSLWKLMTILKDLKGI